MMEDTVGIAQVKTIGLVETVYCSKAQAARTIPFLRSLNRRLRCIDADDLRSGERFSQSACGIARAASEIEYPARQFTRCQLLSQVFDAPLNKIVAVLAGEGDADATIQHRLVFVAQIEENFRHTRT